jgi:O-antigen ligase
VGALTALEPGAAAAVTGALVLLGLVLATRSVFPPADLEGRQFRWVAVAWAFLLIQPVGHFSTGRSALTAVSGAPSVENVIELGTSATIAALALVSLKRYRFGVQPSLLILSFPALALVSAAWSLAPTVTLGFSFELIAMVLLATFTAAILLVDPTLGRSLVHRSLRYVVVGVALLCLVGLVFRSGWTAAGPPARFTWPGTHPLVAAAATGLALLILAFGDRRDLGFARPARVALLVLFAICVYLAHARTALAGLAVAGLFGYWFVSRGTGALRRLAGTAAIAVTVFVVVSAFSGPVTQYLYRGQSAQQVYSLDGRFGLWALALQELHSPGRWLVGYGLGGTRVIFATSTTWAADAHSAWLELLLSLGLVGVAAAVALVAVLAVRLLSASSSRSLPSHVLPILFVYVLAMSPVAAGFAAPGPEPGLGFALLALCGAASATRERGVGRAASHRGAKIDPDLMPVPI